MPISNGLKWSKTSSITSACTIQKLRMVVTTHGSPEMLAIDNGSAFISDEFTTFLKQNGVKHVRTSTHHPASNGLAERAVQSFKAAMKKSPSVPIQVAWFSFQYRLTPHTTTGFPTTEMLIGRILTSGLDLLHTSHQVQKTQDRQKSSHDVNTTPRTFRVGDMVLAKNFSPNPGTGDGEGAPIHMPMIRLETVKNHRMYCLMPSDNFIVNDVNTTPRTFRVGDMVLAKNFSPNPAWMERGTGRERQSTCL